jgi:transposase
MPLVCAHATRAPHQNICSPNSTLHISTMKRAFGTEISGNRGPDGELSSDARAGIFSAVEHGVPKSQIASQYACDRRTVYNTINRWNNNATTKSLLRSGPPRKHSRAQERMLVRYVRRFPEAAYKDLEDVILGVSFKRRTAYRILKKHGITNWRARQRPRLI